MQVAIDGPSASGKSAVAKLLAKRLGYVYIDTGAMYRAVTLSAKKKGIDFGDESALTRIAEEIKIDIKSDRLTERGYKILIDGENITEQLFNSEIDSLVSLTARVPGVRLLMAEAQRKIAGSHNVIMAGRDIASNVLPLAEVKIFLNASPQCRAERRRAELSQKGEESTYEEILAIIKMRDKIDSERKDNPLIKTPDAIEIDSTSLPIIEVVKKIEKIIKEREGNNPLPP